MVGTGGGEFCSVGGLVERDFARKLGALGDLGE